MSERGLSPEQVTGFLSPRKKELRREADAGRHWEVIEMEVHTRGKRVAPKRSRPGVFISPGLELVRVHRRGSFISSPGRDPCFPPFLLYVVPWELPWHPVHDGSRSDHNANEIIMTLK